MAAIPLYEFRKKALRLPSPLARARLTAMARSIPRTAWRIFRLTRIARRQGKRLHLVFLPSHLGDVVAAEPAVRALVSDDILLVWLICPQYADILKNIPWLGGIVPITCHTEWLFLRPFFCGLTTTTMFPDEEPCAWFRFSIRNRNPFGITFENYYSHGSLLSVFSQCGLGRIIDEQPKVYPDPAFPPNVATASLALYPKTRYIVLHCVSQEVARTWPAEKFRAVVDWILVNTDLHIVELGIEPILVPSSRLIQPKLRFSLDQQMQFVASASLFIGVDSGFAHIANACGVPSIIVMGKFKQWNNHMPFSGAWARSDRFRLLRADGQIADLSCQRVIGALREVLGKESD